MPFRKIPIPFVTPEEIIPLSIKDANFYPRRFIGDCAENLAEFLLNCSGYNCLRLGMENHMNALKKEIKDYSHQTNNRLRSMPDLVAIKDKKAYLIEVKWIYQIWEGRFVRMTPNFIDNYKSFWNDAYLLIITSEEPFFHIVQINQITNDMFRGMDSNGKNRYETWDFSKIIINFQLEFKIKTQAIEIAKPIITKIKEISTNPAQIKTL